jgi:hypothetical protein
VVLSLDNRALLLPAWGWFLLFLLLLLLLLRLMLRITINNLWLRRLLLLHVWLLLLLRGKLTHSGCNWGSNVRGGSIRSIWLLLLLLLILLILRSVIRIVRGHPVGLRGLL